MARAISLALFESRERAEVIPFGEPVTLFDGAGRMWIARLGYDAYGDETFLDIREPEDLRLVAGAWLGFHAQFAAQE